ncbi:hypothetical protein JR316_0000592 [Psilocybe cubensis]|uniref:Uncharacterized protein n=2 Tax=Psilocybe cubensis TaxID=181762 RepID=A0ACB8HFN7_PSICU|nr:hypothetical protein JR316_0000592 [Psilocybe cubensis]KAH9486527.1 hypothetical protein JR316_0000592 [Psilocybe cubensis]
MDNTTPTPTPTQNQNVVQPKKPDLMLPVGKRNWDLEQEGEIHSVAASGALLKSLRQSRERWLFHTFPKFSSKSRGNKASLADVTPLNHTIHTQGKCDLEIGPQKFEDTSFFAVHYLSSPASFSQPATSQNTVPNTASWHSNVPYGSPYTYTNAAPPPTSIQSNISSPQAQPGTPLNPLMNSLTADSVPNGLVYQVNLAASTNPILSNLLQLAAARRATPDQLQTLGLLIQSLPNIESSLAACDVPPAAEPLPPPTNSNHYRAQPPAKDFDLILEYRETPNERWIIPRGCYPVAVKSGSDILLTVCVVGKQETPSIPLSRVVQDPESPDNYDRPVTITLKNAPSNLWDTIMRWIGGHEKMELNKKYQDSLTPPQRLFLGLQLSSNESVLAQLQAASTQPFSMKTLKQGPTTHSRRPGRAKAGNTQRRTTATHQKPGSQPSEAAAKKSRIMQARFPPSTPIQCLSCKQGDVPLLLGGRYCRTCVESGKWKSDLAQSITPVQFVQSHLQSLQPTMPVTPAAPVTQDT